MVRNECCPDGAAAGTISLPCLGTSLDVLLHVALQDGRLKSKPIRCFVPIQPQSMLEAAIPNCAMSGRQRE